METDTRRNHPETTPKHLGASCDWDRTAFTMDEDPLRKCFESICRPYTTKDSFTEESRMVNWDPKALTALSDEEVIYKDEHSKLYYLRYFIEGEDRCIIVATTRPETIMGDTAVCVSTPTTRANHALTGKKGDRTVGRVARYRLSMDDYVDIEFGTGCLKVTPAHDVNDYMLGEKYQSADYRHIQRQRNYQRSRPDFTSAWTVSTYASRSPKTLQAGRVIRESRTLRPIKSVLFRTYQCRPSSPNYQCNGSSKWIHLAEPRLLIAGHERRNPIPPR